MSARQLYAQRAATILRSLGEIDRLLQRHDARQASDPLNYGYAGDLGRVLELLDEARAALGGTR